MVPMLAELAGTEMTAAPGTLEAVGPLIRGGD
jgi:hypothetical protein